MLNTAVYGLGVVIFIRYKIRNQLGEKEEEKSVAHNEKYFPLYGFHS